MGKPPAGGSPQTGSVRDKGAQRADKAAAPEEGPRPAASKSITSLLGTLKLPPGAWSASILSFAKFFSLPLESAFIGKIRRQVLAAEGGQAGAVEPAAAGLPAEGRTEGPPRESLFREALSLAAAAAAAKGVELPPEALAEYAGALLRGRRRREDSPEGGRRDSGGGAEGGTGEGPIPPGAGEDAGRRRAGGQDEAGGSPGKGEAVPRRSAGALTGEALRERALAAQGPLLELLNTLPGKEGKRWIVLPFSLDEDLDGCLRILLAPPGGPARAERMGLDIRRGGEFWTCLFRAGAEQASAPPSLPPLFLDLSRRPALHRAEEAALKRELAEFLGIPPERITIREFPILAEDSRDRALPSLNEEV